MNFPRYERYKDSGVEWLGEIPEHWSVRKIKFLSQYNQEALEESTDLNLSLKYVDIGSVSQGSINKVEEFIFKNAPSRARRKAKKGSTVISTVRTYLKAIAYVNSDASEYVFSTGFCVLYPSHHINNVFFTYLLQSEDFISEVIRSSEGVSYPAITPIKLCNIKVCFPSLAEQERIAEFLDRKCGEIDAAIAKKQRLIELLDEQKTILINQAVTKGLNPDAPMKDSGIDCLGQIPAHWEVKKIGQSSKVARGASPRPAGHPRFFSSLEGTPWVTVAEITKDTDSYLNFTKEYLTKIGVKNSQFFTKETVLLSNSGATLGVPKILKIDCCANDGVLAFKRLKANISSRFLYFFLASQTRRFREEIKQGSGQPNLNTNILKNTPMPIPNFDEQEQIVGFIVCKITEIDSLIQKQEYQISKLTELKQILIAEAVTGKIKV
jgi:type I restriction enzyme S subunit